MSNETSIDLKQCVLDAVLSGLIALVVFGPIVGVVLDGYGSTCITSGSAGSSRS